MAAPCRRMAGRPLLQFLTCFNRAVGGQTRFCRFSGTPVGRTQLQVDSEVTRWSSPWNLMAAVCVQRLPVISAESSPVEQRFRHMIQENELERSLLSDHELRLMEDAQWISRKQADDYDSDEEEDGRDQDIVLAQDLEDSWEQKLEKFQPAPRVRADVDKDLTSVERCLADSLVLLAEQQVGSGRLWLMPQAQWQEGETLRQTAERALHASMPDGFKATFLGNAPCGVYKYKLPRASRTEGCVGTKVFFFKAVVSDAGSSAALNSPVMWLKKSELQRYLKPAYMVKVERFVLDL